MAKFTKTKIYNSSHSNNEVVFINADDISQIYPVTIDGVIIYVDIVLRGRGREDEELLQVDPEFMTHLGEI